VVNEVKCEYDTNGQLAREYQNPSGVASTSSLYTGYTYDTTKSGEFFTKRLRMTSQRYPSATTINYTYGTSGSVDDLLNRFKAVQNGSTNVVEYTDMGVATPAIVKYPQPNLTLDYTATGALDRFGRITDHAWKNAGGTSLVQIRHGYDRVGNRLYREDIAATNAGKSFDELYAYDGMNQLIDMQRGRLNTAKNGIASGKNYQDNFAFDATGNWSTYKQDTTGAGFNLTQARTHNKANEIATIAGASTHVAHDANGNMTKSVLPHNWATALTLVYDAWNRLVIARDGATTVATCSYNGLNHRVRKIVGSETKLFYFNNWQCLEEYVGSTCDARYVWGLRYIDDLVTYRKGSTDYYSLADANWNVIALTNASGVAQERYNYSAFGKVNIFDAALNVRSASSCSITRAFTGQVRDNETGLMLYRNRIYHTTLGRFVQRDPIGYNAGDVNLMRYVGNRARVKLDMFGLQVFQQSPPNPYPQHLGIGSYPGGNPPVCPWDDFLERYKKNRESLPNIDFSTPQESRHCLKILAFIILHRDWIGLEDGLEVICIIIPKGGFTNNCIIN
jgi:RHS repeat-associated protein